MEDEDFLNIKAGDVVLITSRWHGQTSFRRVSKITPTQIVIDRNRYARTRKPMRSPGTSSYDGRISAIATAEEVAKWEHANNLATEAYRRQVEEQAAKKKLASDLENLFDGKASVSEDGGNFRILFFGLDENGIRLMAKSINLGERYETLARHHNTHCQCNDIY